MGKKSGPAAPPAPDPTVVSQAQSASNIATAEAQQRLNMINTAGPQGSVTYAADATAPGGYRQTTALSAPEQQIYDAQKATELGATNIAQDQLGRVQTALQTPLDTQGLPALRGATQGGPIATSFDPGGQIQSGFDKGQQLQYGFNPGQQVQGQVGPADLNAAAQQAQNAVYGQATSRLDPRFSQEENALRTRLANQGLGENSTAFQTAMQNYGQTKNDAYNQAQFSAIGAGNDAAQQLFGQSVTQGQFANDAAAQMYGQNQGQAQFHNTTANQDYTQNLGAAEFGNNAQQQQFGQNQAQAAFQNTAQQQQFGQGVTGAQLDNTARQQGLQERAYVQNAPINQLTGLLSLGQVGMPTGVQYTPSQVGQTDVTGAYALQSQAQQANANRAAQSQSGLMGGLMSLGSAAIMASDPALKTDVRLIRRRADGLGLYAYRYLTDLPGIVRIGVMADEVKKVRPELVVRRADGFMAVDYSAIDLEAA